MYKRFRKQKSNKKIRKLFQNLKIDINDFIYPLFVEEGNKIKTEILSMPGQFRFSIDMLEIELKELLLLGVDKVLLFGIPSKKDLIGSEAYNENGIIQKACKMIKERFPEILIITDVCMCEYTSHGHCGIIEGGNVNNDKTLEKLKKIVLSHLKSGSDVIAPSDMMDGRVNIIKNFMEENGFIDTPIMSYTVKFASNFYGPFRDAADSTPDFGDRKNYQMDYRRDNEYIQKVTNDIKEGSDIVIVKPALPYLDVVSDIKNRFDITIAAYNVSGEYAMIKAASEKGWLDEKKVVLEKMYSLKRAGADIIISYHTKDIAKWIKNGENL